MKKIKDFLINNSSEIILILGLFLISYASFTINKLLGLYITGFILTSLGLFLAREPTKKNKS